jgi:hypothetical protein
MAEDTGIAWIFFGTPSADGSNAPIQTFRSISPHATTAALCLPKTLSGMARGWAYGNEAADGGVSDPAAAYYAVAVHAASAS